MASWPRRLAHQPSAGERQGKKRRAISRYLAPVGTAVSILFDNQLVVRDNDTSTFTLETGVWNPCDDFFARRFHVIWIGFSWSHDGHAGSRETCITELAMSEMRDDNCRVSGGLLFETRRLPAERRARPTDLQVMSRRQISAALLTAYLVCACSHAPKSVAADDTGTDPKGVEFFERQIAPILKRRCYECHSHESGKAKGGLVLDSRRGWEKGGSEGAAIVPGKPKESLLIDAIRYGSYEMPPKTKLPKREIELLEKWVAIGAPDPRVSKVPSIDPKRLWALQPIKNHSPAIVDDKRWPRDDLDAFILAGLEKQGLRPADDADRYMLLRRVTFDLTGLPPTVEEIDEFMNDESELAYERVVDRLLKSPGFGDNWGRHWFDLSCYADLADVTGNMLIRDAWRYRDYVIASFNSDKPLDRFVHEQIAGDLLPFDNVPQQREQIIATGYLAIGPWVLQNYIKGQLAADVVDHQIDRIGRTFLGQTISCARCHDHKFDPIPTRDYYALAGIFHSTRTTSYDGPGVWSVINETTLPIASGTSQEVARRKKTLKQLRERRQAIQTKLATLLLKIPGGTDANVLTLKEPIAANVKGQQYKLRFLAGPSVWAGGSQATTACDGLRIDLVRNDGSVLAGFVHNPGPWSGKLDAQKLKAADYSFTGDGRGEIQIRLTSASPGNGKFGGAINNLTIRDGESTVFSEDFDSLIPGPIEGSQADTKLRVLAKARVPGWLGGGINHSHAVDLGNGDYAVQFFGGGTKGLEQAKPKTQSEKEAYAQAKQLNLQLDDVIATIAKTEQENAPQHALAVRDTDKPSDSPIFQRGDFQSLGDVVPRGFVDAILVSQRFDIPKGTSGRLQLAHWLTAPDNPLTSRVLVNRVWRHLFGEGLVRTVDYFGVHGETPSHPELLDFLAVRMREIDNWSLKKTVRHMVLSHTYQMASTYNASAAKLDPENRLLWRMPRRRLTAESIRDAILSASGQLDPRRGRPSLGLELKGNINGLGGDVNPATWAGKIPDYIMRRRSVYLPFKRERPLGELEILSVFDFPHPSDITGARPNTTVATQALFLLNAPFVKQQATKLAERLKQDEPDDERDRINRLYLLTLGRPATSPETETALTFLTQCAEELKGDRATAWTQLCHAVLGSNSFLFRE